VPAVNSDITGNLCTKIKDWKAPASDARELGTASPLCNRIHLAVEPASTSAEPPGNFPDLELTVIFNFFYFFFPSRLI